MVFIDNKAGFELETGGCTGSEPIPPISSVFPCGFRAIFQSEGSVYPSVSTGIIKVQGCPLGCTNGASD